MLLELVLAYGSPIAVQIYRDRRVSTPAQRQQTRWVIFGLTCAILVFLLSAFTEDLIPVVGVASSLSYLASTSLQALAVLLIPWSITIAILRTGNNAASTRLTMVALSSATSKTSRIEHEPPSRIMRNRRIRTRIQLKGKPSKWS